MKRKLFYTKLSYKHFALMQPEISYIKGSLLIELFCEMTDNMPRYFMCIDKKDVYEVAGGQYQLWKDQHALSQDEEHCRDMMKMCLAKAEEHKELAKFFMDAYNTYKERLKNEKTQ